LLRTVAVLPLARADREALLEGLGGAISGGPWILADEKGRSTDSMQSILSRADLETQEIRVAAVPETPGPDAAAGADEPDERRASVAFILPRRSSIEALLSDPSSPAARNVTRMLVGADGILVVPPAPCDAASPDDGADGWGQELRQFVAFANSRLRLGYAKSKAITIVAAAGCTAEPRRLGVPEDELSGLDVEIVRAGEGAASLGAALLEAALQAVRRSEKASRQERQRIAPIAAIVGALLLTLLTAVYISRNGGTANEVGRLETRIDRVIGDTAGARSGPAVEDVINKGSRLLADVADDHPRRGELARVLSRKAGAWLRGIVRADSVQGALSVDEYRRIGRVLKQIPEFAPDGDMDEVVDDLMERLSRDFRVTGNLVDAELASRRKGLVEVAEGLLNTGLKQSKRRGELQAKLSGIYGTLTRSLIVAQARARLRGQYDSPAERFSAIREAVKESWEYPCAPLVLPEELMAELEGLRDFLGAVPTRATTVVVQLTEAKVSGTEEGLKALCGNEVDLMMRVMVRKPSPKADAGGQGTPVWEPLRNLKRQAYDAVDVDLTKRELDSRGAGGLGRSSGPQFRHEAVKQSLTRVFTWEVPWYPGVGVKVAALDNDTVGDDVLMEISTDLPAGYTRSDNYLPDLGLGLFHFLGREGGIEVSLEGNPIDRKSEGKAGAGPKVKALARVSLRFDVSLNGVPFLESIPRLLLEAR
jgi:hypothetical protein